MYIAGSLYACTYMHVFTSSISCASDHHTPLYPSVTAAMETQGGSASVMATVSRVTEDQYAVVSRNSNEMHMSEVCHECTDTQTLNQCVHPVHEEFISLPQTLPLSNIPRQIRSM